MGELVHVFGGASKFLHLQDGRQGLDIMDLVEGELKTILASSLDRAPGLATPLTFRSVQVVAGASPGDFKITVRRVRGRGSERPHFLISFEPVEQSESKRTAATELNVAEVSREQLATLEAELKYTKENLQAASEELESKQRRAAGSQRGAAGLERRAAEYQ